MIALVSAMAMIGRNLQNSKNNVQNNPKLPTNIPISTGVGRNNAQLDGVKSRQSEVTIITNRSNHIPMFTKIQTTTIIHGVVRIFLNQKTCGIKTLQLTMIQ